jgi:hypothetical protein
VGQETAFVVLKPSGNKRHLARDRTNSIRNSASGSGIGSWQWQAKAKSITRAAMPALIAARRSTTTKPIAVISFRHC